MSSIDALPIAKAYSSKALALDSTLAEAWTTVGFIQSHYEYDWNGGKKNPGKSDPYEPKLSSSSFVLWKCAALHWEQNAGISEVKKALELDPLSIQLIGLLPIVIIPHANTTWHKSTSENPASFS